MRICVVLSVGHVDTIERLRSTISNILELLPSGGFVVLSMDDYSSEALRLEVAGLCTSESFATLVIHHIKDKKQTFALTYLNGVLAALERGAEAIIELDFGAHSTDDLPKFINALNEGYEFVFSSRYANNALVSNYPLQRRFISRVGTLLSSLLTVGCFKVDDLTSGYEAFTSDFIHKVFAKYPKDKFVSISSAGHLYQTELRLYSLWTGGNFCTVPISYGEGKKGKKLPYWYLYRSLSGFLRLIPKRFNARSG